MSHVPFFYWRYSLRRCYILEGETYNWPVAEAIIYVCSLILLTAISSRRCQCDTVSSREQNTDVAEEPQGSTSRLRSSSCTLLCAYSPLSLASLEPLNFLSWFILHRCFAWIKHFVKVSIFTNTCTLLKWHWVLFSKDYLKLLYRVWILLSLLHVIFVSFSMCKAGYLFCLFLLVLWHCLVPKCFFLTVVSIIVLLELLLNNVCLWKKWKSEFFKKKC